ncbi:hypothetical protein [Streptomyces cucumeris]|uniref:hypothetical protein n=1 Tax=Streptomyces cucumeris TaxID=2962890 RepID=UPI003D76287B
MTAPVPDLYTRAALVFGKTDRGGIAWPYGVADPDRSNYRGPNGPTEYEERLKDRRIAQRVVTEWAERHGLKKSTTGCCPLWLLRRVSRRCTSTVIPCTHYGSSTPDRGWLDHLTAWTKNGKPAALTSAPYSLPASDEARLTWWTQEDPRLHVARGKGWYGLSTTQIVMWRSDLLAALDPA